MIVEQGQVAPALEPVLKGALERSKASSKTSSGGAIVQDARQRRVLLLGAGMVAGPLVDYLAAIPGTQMTIGTPTPQMRVTAFAQMPL